MTVSGAPPDDLPERASRVCAAWLEQLADDREERPYGFAMRRRNHPMMWDHNALVVIGSRPGLEAITLADDADAFLSGLAHRKVHVLDEATGDRLRPGFERMGWRAEELLGLGSRDTPPAVRPGSPAVAEVESTDEVADLRMTWWRSEAWGQDQEDLDRVLQAERDAERRHPPRVFVTTDDAGRPLSFCFLRRSHADPSLGEIDDVFCHADVRGTGRGAAVVLAAWHAARAEGCDAVFLWADATGDARRFYERLGLRPLRRRSGFLRRLA